MVSLGTSKSVWTIHIRWPGSNTFSNPSALLFFLSVSGMTEYSSSHSNASLLGSGGLIGSPNEALSQVIPFPLDDPLLLLVPWSDQCPVVPALRRGITVTSAEQHLQVFCMQSLDGLGLAGNKMVVHQVLAFLKTNKGRALGQT